MNQEIRYRLARYSYWLLFIMAPVVGLFFFLGASGSRAASCFGFGMILILTGEHAFRPWKRLWRVED